MKKFTIFLGIIVLNQIKFAFTSILSRLPTKDAKLNVGLQVSSFGDLIAVAEITEESSFFTKDDDESTSSSAGTSLLYLSF